MDGKFDAMSGNGSSNLKMNKNNTRKLFCQKCGKMIIILAVEKKTNTIFFI